MSSLFMSLVFVLLIFITGYLLTQILFEDSFNIFEKYGAAFGIGLGANFSTLFILSIARIPISLFTISLSFIFWITLSLMYLKKREKLSNLLPKLRRVRLDFFPIFLGLLLFTIFYIIFFRTITLGFSAWDEFSYWGKASRMIFSSHNIFIQPYVTADSSSNPLFWPASAGSMSIFTGEFVENYIKLLTPILFMSLGVFLFGYFDRLKLKINEKLLFLVLYFSSGQYAILYATTLYADIPYIYFFSIGVLTLYRWLYEEMSVNKMFVVLPFFLILTITKLGGSILAIASIVAVALFTMKKVFTKENFMKLSLIPLIIAANQIFWIILSKFMGQTQSTLGNKAFQNFGYAIDNAQILAIQMARILNNKYGFNYFWGVVLVLVIVGLFAFRKKVYGAILLNFIFYVSYLMFAYAVLFTQRELLMLASFERYVMPVMPLFLFGIAYFYRDAQDFLLAKVKALEIKR
jgi:hypothetical protein